MCNGEVSAHHPAVDLVHKAVSIDVILDTGSALRAHRITTNSSDEFFMMQRGVREL